MYFYTKNYDMLKDRNPKLLLPYDFTEVSKFAIQHAIALAKIFGYSITLLNIYDSSTRKFLRENGLAKADLDAKLQETADSIKQSGNVDADHFFKKGSIKTIRRLSDELKVSLMVIGIDEPKLRVSPILKVVSKSPVPVMVVQQQCELFDYKHLLFPLDDFPGSRQKVGWAARLAKLTSAKVSIFASNQSDKEKRYKQIRVVEQVEEFFHKRGIPYTSQYAEGNIKSFPDEALKFGIDQKCDVFIIMYQPKKAFSSVTQLDKKLIFNDSRIPVLCVNTRDVGISGGFN
jgi:nucleotide-binding universal stress UspA family protein